MDIRTQGVVLGRKRVADHDAIITVLTKTQGKVRLYVNGARLPKSRFAMVAHPFVVGTYQYYQKGDLSTLNNADIDEAHYHLREDLDKLFIGTYMLELIEVSIEDGDHVPRLFDLVTHALSALEKTDAPKVLKLIYTLKVIQRLGFEPQILNCSVCGTDENLMSVFSVRSGGVVCRDCLPEVMDAKRVSLDSLKWINVALKSPYASIQGLVVSDTIISTVDSLLNQFVETHVARRKLKSLDMLKGI